MREKNFIDKEAVDSYRLYTDVDLERLTPKSNKTDIYGEISYIHHKLFSLLINYNKIGHTGGDKIITDYTSTFFTPIKLMLWKNISNFPENF